MATNDEIVAKLDAAALERNRHGKLLEDVHTVVFGNGEPQKGLAFRLTLVERFQGILKKAAWIAAGALITGGVGILLFR